MSRKRRTSEKELSDHAEEDDDESMEDIQDDGKLDLASPSPEAKKDMFLRSGRRKRRRSKETSGLTPPEKATAKKKARKSTIAKKSKTTNGRASLPPAPKRQSQQFIDYDSNGDDDDEKEIRKIPPIGRESILLADHRALTAAQEPLSNHSSEVNSPVNDLFHGKPPAMSTTTKRKKQGVSAQRRILPDEEASRNSNPAPTLSTTTTTTSNAIGLRFLFLVFFSLSFMTIWPLCVKMTEFIIPLKESTVVVEEIIEVEVQDETTAVVSESILTGMETLKGTIGSTSQITDSLKSEKDALETLMSAMKTLVKANRKKLKNRYSRLEDAEKALMEALKEKDISSGAWDDAREVLEGLGKDMLETSSLKLWQVDDPVTCDKTGVVTREDPILEAKVLKDGESNLLLKASMTAQKITGSETVEENIRAWVREQIDAALAKDEASTKALNDLKKPKEGKKVNNLDELIQDRLQLEHADGTGLYDHASRVNGAKVIYGGKRGTTKSLVDSLPLYNRLMQLSRLRFYGYGPEAAITPTYPRHALGQCWSFQQMAVKEQIKRKRLQKDDHKHGNFGTLTISLPAPVSIWEVSIEHPPETITDNRQTAIRSFRVIGYEDKLAEGEAWSLGSFEYDIAGAPLQMFDVTTDMFGNPVPKMLSVSLAIDSNWGEEYACLYRFRVHGDDGRDEE